MVRETLLEGFPHVDICVSIIWIHMLESDSKEAAREAARMMDDPRVRQFHDPERLVGRAIAGSLGSEDRIAWDFYLFYEQGLEWGERPPAPTAWAHQLSADWTDPARFHWAEDLVKELEQLMSELAGKPPGA